MKIKYYHGTTKEFQILEPGSWLTRIDLHAICQAEKREQERGEAGKILEVEADDSEVREVGANDRNSENFLNIASEESGVRISTVKLPVLKAYGIAEAKRLFYNPRNLLPPI